MFGRNSVDQPIYLGAAVRSSAPRCRPRPLWDGKDYKKLEQIANSSNSTSAEADRANQERYRWVEFHKWQFKAQWFQSFLKNSNLVLMLKAEMGYLGSYNKYKVSPFERYEVGGDGMSGYNIYGIDIIAMRGYEDGALDPGSNYSRGYNKYTAELRYLIIPETFVADLRAGIPWKAVTHSTRGRILALPDRCVGRLRRPPLSARGGYARYRLGLRIRRSGELLDQERQPVPILHDPNGHPRSSEKGSRGVAINLKEKSYIYSRTRETG